MKESRSPNEHLSACLVHESLASCSLGCGVFYANYVNYRTQGQRPLRCYPSQDGRSSAFLRAYPCGPPSSLQNYPKVFLRMADRWQFFSNALQLPVHMPSRADIGQGLDIVTRQRLGALVHRHYYLMRQE